MAKGKRDGPLMLLARALLLGLWLLVAIPTTLVPLYAAFDPVSVPMLVRMALRQPLERDWRDIDAVANALKTAVIMSEDGQFCRHWGVDVTALREEIEDALEGRPARGASTITMQVARNLSLWNDRSYIRKGLEVPLALYLDRPFKKRIFEIYLNIAEWGPDGRFGVEAGAQHAFGRGPDALSWSQAARLAVILPNPIVRSAATPSPKLRRVAAIVEGRARSAKPAQVDCVM